MPLLPLAAATFSSAPIWLPSGALEYINVPQERYFTNGAVQPTLSDALTGASYTFTRATQASYYNSNGILAYAASGAIRQDYDPTTGAALGMLIERAMTPLISNTEAFDNAYWTKTLCTVSANQDVAPDGTTTGDRMIPNAVTSSNIQIVNATVVTLTSGTRYAWSGFAKPDANTNVPYVTFGFSYSALWHAGWYSLITRSAGVVQQGGVAPQTAVRNGGNGWLRCLFSHQTSGTAQRVGVAPSTSNGVLGYTGDGSKYASIWGVQLEQGDFATSYNAGVARNADILIRTITTPVRFTRQVGFTAPIGYSTNVIWQMDDGTAANRVRLVRDTAGAVRFIITASSVETVNYNLGTVDNLSFNRVAIGFDGTTFSVVMNANPTIQTATTSIPAVTVERIGSSATPGEEFCGWIPEWASYGQVAPQGLRELSRVFPSWVITDNNNQPADGQVDFVNGRYWYLGRTYPTLDTFKSALGATSAAAADFNWPGSDASVTSVVEVLCGSAKNAGAAYSYFVIDDGVGGKYQKTYLSTLNAIGDVVFWGTPQWGKEDPKIFSIYNTTRWAQTWDSSNFSLSLEGKTPYTQASGSVINTPSTYRIGNNADGTQPVQNGEIWKVAWFFTPKSSSQVQLLANANFPLVAVGDSYGAGVGGVGFQQSISRYRKRMMLNVAVGGSTIADQAAVATATMPSWPNAILIQWDGDDNGYDPDINVDLAYYAQIVQSVTDLGSNKYVIATPLPRTGQSAAQQQRCRDLLTALSALYPGHIVDPFPITASLNDGSPADLAAIAQGCCPPSQLQDGVHLVQGAMDACALTGATWQGVFYPGMMTIVDTNGWLIPE